MIFRQYDPNIIGAEEIRFMPKEDQLKTVFRYSCSVIIIKVFSDFNKRKYWSFRLLKVNCVNAVLFIKECNAFMLSLGLSVCYSVMLSLKCVYLKNGYIFFKSVFCNLNRTF